MASGRKRTYMDKNIIDHIGRFSGPERFAEPCWFMDWLVMNRGRWYHKYPLVYFSYMDENGDKIILNDKRGIYNREDSKLITKADFEYLIERGMPVLIYNKAENGG